MTTTLGDSDALGLQEAVLYAYGASVQGQFIEFGTLNGNSSQVIAEIMAVVDSEGQRPPKHLFLFDSFKGLPEFIAAEDRECPHGVNKEWFPGCMVGIEAGLAERIGRCLPAGRFTIVDGWFADTVHRIPDKIHFALVHVDCDLYQSTIDALQPLFHRGQISEGAVICFDDWNCNRGSNRYGERAAFAHLCQAYDIDAERWGPYGWHGMRFLIHGYRSCPI